MQQGDAATDDAADHLERADDATGAEHAHAALFRFVEQLVDERAGDDTAASAADAARRQRAEEVATSPMRSTIVRTALAASAGALACLLVQALAAGRRAAHERATRRECGDAVSGWENEGGGLAVTRAAEPR